MNPYAISVVFCCLLFVAMTFFAIVGHRTGRRALRLEPEAKKMGTGVVDAGILSLLGLLTAFTFSSAYSRYEERRQLIVEEVNAISTAYLRLDLLPADRQPAIRSKFRDYVKSRYELWKLLPNRTAALAEYDWSEKLQRSIWDETIAVVKNGESGEHGEASKLLLPALNDMIDITAARLLAVQAHPPVIIFLLLGSLSLGAAWIIGFGMARSGKISYLHVIGFAAMGAFTLYIILDIEYPRFGLVTLDMPHQLLLDFYQQIK